MASESEKAQTSILVCWGCRTVSAGGKQNKNNLERLTVEGDSPVLVMLVVGNSILSRSAPVKRRLNLPAPSGKAKYYRETDSELVP